MANKIKNLNLYTVRVRPATYASQIEAQSDEEAVAKAVKCVGGSSLEHSIVSKEPIYEETIGIQCDEDKSESAVFEIQVRGVDGAKVDQLAKAIYTFIGGPGMSEEDYRKIHSSTPLVNATNGMMAFI